MLLKACGTRRESRCPSCAATYRADAYQLLAAGLKGGKGVPETVAEHPRLFVTFTAPASAASTPARPKGGWCCRVIPTGKVPAARTVRGMAAGIAMTRTTPGWGSRCARPATTARRRCCGTRWHRSCGDGPPSPSSVPWAGWSASRRASCAGWSACRYAKVAEFQRRGAIHFHAVIRLDAATECRCPGCLAPPPEPFTAALLEDALRQAVPAVRVPCPPVDGGPDRYARWGEQLDVRNITTTTTRRGSCRPSRWPATSPSTRPRPPRASAPASTAA